MQEIKTYNTQDLVLQVSTNYDPIKLNLSAWDRYLDILCQDRAYQKKAIQTAIIYLFSGKYATIEQLVEENYRKNESLQDRYNDLIDYKRRLQLPNLLSATLDLATGTGKSFVMYGIAQLALGLGFVDKVLVLCPSLTIEKGLTEKFRELTTNSTLKNAIPALAVYANPSIIDGTRTIQNGDICIENIHAVYGRNSSSIQDSLGFGKGERCLVLNDEVHHVYNKIIGNDADSKGLKKWKEFLLNNGFGFRYMLGFTGTAYVENDYVNDVVYRYSLRQAIEDGFVKTVDYVAKDEQTQERDEQFQKIYQNHQRNKDLYGSKLKPLTLLVTQDIIQAERLKEELCEFLVRKENVPIEGVRSDKVLIVTSKHKQNVELYLPHVDKQNSTFEWIVSVSMLTEGWDVKNVFQIVPMEERAFNSKLLIAQVLGRGLRLPADYPKAIVVVFNHDNWTGKIKGLVDEILELELKLVAQPLQTGERANYHFTVYNINYTKTQEETPVKRPNAVFDYSKEEIKLAAQIDAYNPITTFVNTRAHERTVEYRIEKELFSVESIVNKIYEEFRIREWEGVTLKLKDGEYTKNNLPPKEVIERLIRNSMEARAIEGDYLDKHNQQAIFNSFNTLLRKTSKKVVTKRVATKPIAISTINRERETLSVSNLRRDSSVFYSPDYETELVDDEVRAICTAVLEDESLPRKAIKEVKTALLKTPVDLVFSTAEPERKFIELLTKPENAAKITAWVKSKNQRFYEIEYSITSDAGKHSRLGKFNPDFLLLIKTDEHEFVLVVEIKADGDVSPENKAKLRYARQHFRELNTSLEENGIAQTYLFHFLSPQDYAEFFGYLQDGRLVYKDDPFRSRLENLLED
ncbi:DEAD/DEAH box helicase family protein [Nibrella viscosa]|uniref:DEAD/DEAH box helicase family protein n=1 Tax=Nibrella viscosa TaxID=1084524 RepID=A0ABP8KYK2_9BACT